MRQVAGVRPKLKASGTNQLQLAIGNDTAFKTQSVEVMP
jgi:hypothetical protein